jgi:hypothetical protein
MISPKSGEVIKIFETLSDASRYLVENGMNNTTFENTLKLLSKACNGKVKTAYKYIWQFTD